MAGNLIYDLMAFLWVVLVLPPEEGLFALEIGGLQSVQLSSV